MSYYNSRPSALPRIDKVLRQYKTHSVLPSLYSFNCLLSQKGPGENLQLYYTVCELHSLTKSTVKCPSLWSAHTVISENMFSLEWSAPRYKFTYNSVSLTTQMNDIKILHRTIRCYTIKLPHITYSVYNIIASQNYLIGVLLRIRS